MGSLKLQSFEEFANASAKAAAVKLEEEQSAARNAAADQFKSLLAEFGATSLKDLNEEERGKFYAKLGASEISESVAIIEEGTRSQVGRITKRGKIESVYMHYDGYPDHMLPTIKKGYKDGANVQLLLKKGGGSGLEADPAKINFYGDKHVLKGDAKNIDKYLKDADYDGGAEFVYLYDERDGKWYMADIYGGGGLTPAFESFIINEAFVPSKGNLRDAKKVSKSLEQIMMEAVALTRDKETHLGAVKYLLMYALEDANFHSYMEPVAKKIGGKIRTIMVSIDELGGIELPIGAKTIQKFLDQRYSNLSSAAGWSGIGLVEGVAMYLDGWGFSKEAQAIVDQFNLIWQNESVMNEGNAFLAARAKAIEEDAEEFEFNGKTYPVIKESDEAICEATVEMDALDPDNKDFLKFLKKNRVKIINKVMDGPGGGTPVITMQGKRKDLEKVLADPELGWDDPDLAEYIEEGNAFGAARAEAIAKGDDKFKVGDEEYPVEDVDAEDKENAEEFAAEGNAFGAARAEAIAKGEKEFTVDGETYPVEDVDAEDKENAEEFANEEAVTEAEVKSDEDFKEYAFSVLQKAFGDKFDEEKAQEVVDGLLSKHGEDYGAAVGALQSSLG
jgi:hypothetical protein